MIDGHNHEIYNGEMTQEDALHAVLTMQTTLKLLSASGEMFMS